MSTEIPVTNPKGQTVGHIVIENGKAELRKKVNRLRHMLRRPAGWATDEVHIQLLRATLHQWNMTPYQGFIVLTDDSGVVWRASLQQFFENGFVIDRRFGVQRVLPEGQWQQIDKRQQELHI